MALTPSQMIPLGSTAPAFALTDVVSGSTVSLAELKGSSATVIMFICNHCPYVKHVNEGLIQLAKDYSGKGVSFIAICSNDAEKYPEDSAEKMKEYAAQLGYPFPYLHDASQEVARAYDAACTPDFYIYNRDLKLAYRGQMDDSRPSNGKPVTGNDLRTALDEIIDGREVSGLQRPSIGCNIKWKNP